MRTQVQNSDEQKKLLEEKNRLLMNQNHELLLQRDHLLSSLQSIGHRKDIVVSIKPDTTVPLEVHRIAALEAERDSIETQMSEYKKRYDDDVLAVRCQLELLTVKYQSLTSKMKLLRKKCSLAKAEVVSVKEAAKLRENVLMKELADAKLFIEKLQEDKDKLLRHICSHDTNDTRKVEPSATSETELIESSSDSEEEEILAFKNEANAETMDLSSSKILQSSHSFDGVIMSLRNENEALKKMMLDYRLTKTKSEEEE